MGDLQFFLGFPNHTLIAPDDCLIFARCPSLLGFSFTPLHTPCPRRNARTTISNLISIPMHFHHFLRRRLRHHYPHYPVAHTFATIARYAIREQGWFVVLHLSQRVKRPFDGTIYLEYQSP